MTIKMSEETRHILQRISSSLEEVTFWLRFQGLARLRETLTSELDTDAKRVAFELTDGEHSRREIAISTGVSDDNVQHWWERWYQLGLVTTSDRFKGRPKRIISLEDVGIRVPKPKRGAPEKIEPSSRPREEHGDHER